MTTQHPAPAEEPGAAEEMAARYLRVELSRPRPDILVCTPIGQLDLLTVPLLRRAMTPPDDHVAIVADLSRLQFMGVAGVEALRQAADARRRVLVVAGGRPVLRVLQMTGVDQLLTLCPSVSAAVDMLSTNGHGAHG